MTLMPFGEEGLVVSSFFRLSFQLRPLVDAVGVRCLSPALFVLARGLQWPVLRTTAASQPAGLAPLGDLALQLLQLFGFRLGVVGIADFK